MKDMLSANVLRYPFSHALNPDAAEMEEILHSWINTHYSFLPEKVKYKYLHTGMGHCGGCTYPKASLTQLKTICRFFIWAFTVDDLYEFSSVAQIQTIEDISMLALREGHYTSNDPLYNQLPTLREDLIAIGSEEWLRGRFCDSLALYFKGIKEALEYRKTKIFPSMEAFTAIRLNDVNVFPMINLAEAITGTVLPDAVIKDAALERLKMLTCRILTWANDYFSAHLEQGKDVFNLVLMTQHHQKCSLEEAYTELVKIHNEDVSEFCSIAGNLPDYPAYNKPVRQYVENLELMIAGYLHWTLELTERYKRGGHPASDIKQLAVHA